MIKRINLIIIILMACMPEILGCTSAIIGTDVNPYGRPLLWKNRDTSTFDNKIEYVRGNGDEFSYVALFNSKDSLLREAWMGMNDMGFAVMNTASYNLKDDNVPEKEMDKEGLIMSKALRRCISVDDFATLLDTLPRPMGVEANFGVIDAYGNGAYFETNNHSYTRYNLEDAENHVLVRTNYSHSGRDNEGFGFIREANAEHLLEPYIKERKVTPEVLTEVLSRSYYHDLLGRDMSQSGEEWVIDQDFIPRYTSTATVVVEGCQPMETSAPIDPDYIVNEYVMWTGLGFPPCSEIEAVFCKEEGVSTNLRGDAITGRAPACDLALKRKAEVFPFTKGNGNKYIQIGALFNEEGSGYVQTLVPENLETYRKTRVRRDGE